ncbi:MAG: M23 family metallopeptidase [Candidatus Cloacimonetes bacterium]|nr:M23 family metallopeptidase [Candidatus Cloacimonadota bacterium]
MRDEDKVPLRDFLAFLQVFLLRAVFYGKFLLFQLSTVNTAVFCWSERLKNAFLAILMRRGGFFTPVPRFGLASLALVSLFSSFFVVGTNNFQTQAQIAQILRENQVENWSEGEVLALAKGVPTTKAETRSEVIEYEIKAGDTLSSIGETYLVSVQALVYINEIQNEDLLTPGEKIKIPPTNGVIHKVKGGENVSSIAQKYEVSPQAIVDMNYLTEPFLLSIAQELVIPDAKIPQKKAPQSVYLVDGGGGLSLQTLPQLTGTGSFAWPTAGTISQYFSWYHTAIDIANRGCGGSVVAADSGTIYFAGWWAGGGGNTIMIDHGNGFKTKYAHLSGFAKTGGSVNRGEAIGFVGATGRAYGCHLHFVVEQSGRAINPLSVL